MKSLRDRCREMVDQMNRNAILRQGSPVDDLMAFVVAERARYADASFAGLVPVVLFFDGGQARDEFIELVRQANPNLMPKKLP